MVEIIDVDAKKETAPELLVPYLQSGTLNFLIGSGASFPAIKTAGYIEAQINSLLTKGDEPAADLLSLEFIEAIDDVHEKIITNSSDPGIKQVVENYSRSSSLIDRILFSRKSVWLPRQATIFTTNYDMFFGSLLNAVGKVEFWGGLASLKQGSGFTGKGCETPIFSS